MKIVCISDTHNLTEGLKIPDGDMLIHAGDLTMGGSFVEVVKAMNWLDSLPHEYKIFIAGNHDFLFDNDPQNARSIYENRDLIYLEDSFAEIEGLKIYGSPWQPWFYDWAFNLDRHTGELAVRWAMIPDDVDILIVHGPPRGILDKVANLHKGCYDLSMRIKKLKNLKLFVCGHIHEAYGKLEYPGYPIFVNASICTLDYEPTNAPIVVEI